MSISVDCHLHTNHSGDGKASMEEMILQGIRLGLTHMCFTEHYDPDFPPMRGLSPDYFLLDTVSYLREFTLLREKYRSQITLSFGVELGLQPHLDNLFRSFVREYPFDFIIGSSHAAQGRDPNFHEFYEGRTEEEAYRAYFSSIPENLRTFTDFDVYGHLDYVVRYGPNKDREYTYEKYKDLIDPILILLLEKQIGLELNTAALNNGLRQLHPCTEILKQYHKLGGRIITVGSDAHSAQRISENFSKAEEILKLCGFRYYTVFSERKPTFISL